MKRITKFSLLLSLVLGLYFPTVFAQSNMTNEMFDLAKLKSGVKNKKKSPVQILPEVTEITWSPSNQVRNASLQTSRERESSTTFG